MAPVKVELGGYGYALLAFFLFTRFFLIKRMYNQDAAMARVEKKEQTKG
jgi:hypothetical protein